MIELKNKLNNLKELYHRGPLGAEMIEDKEKNYFTTTNKYHFAFSMLENIENMQINIAKRRLNLLEKYCSENELEVKLITEIKNIFNERNSTMNQINRIKKIINFEHERIKIDFLKNQFRMFKSFKNNQNEYDNIISILKIFDRYQKTFNEKINTNFIFNNTNNDFGKIEEITLSNKTKIFNTIRFQL